MADRLKKLRVVDPVLTSLAIGYSNEQLVGDQLIIECDSNAHHSSQVAYENDRRRDLLARDLGYQTIRLSYSQIWEYWASTQQSLLQYIRHRVHRRRRRQT